MVDEPEIDLENDAYQLYLHFVLNSTKFILEIQI
jgi:hypothetical protein